jgi:hypothetical protein
MQFAAWCFSLLTRDTPVALMTDMTGTLICKKSNNLFLAPFIAGEDRLRSDSVDEDA